MKIQEYFLRLTDYGTGLLNRLPIEREPQPLEYALDRLAPHLERIKLGEIANLTALARPRADSSTEHVAGVGLNSAGMLVDRLTILIIKEWCLRNKGARDVEKADTLRAMQTLDIIEALARAEPGASAMNSKITNKRAEATAGNWEEAFWGLLTTNLLMWESQEMLYIKNIGEAPCEELRSYIKWFSYSNILRNEYISMCEFYYWRVAA